MLKNKSVVAMYFVSSFDVFYVFPEDVVELDLDNRFVRVKKGYTHQVSFISDEHMGRAVPSPVNLINEFDNLHLYFDGYGYFESDTPLIKNLKQQRSNLSIV